MLTRFYVSSMFNYRLPRCTNIEPTSESSTTYVCYDKLPGRHEMLSQCWAKIKAALAQRLVSAELNE